MLDATSSSSMTIPWGATLLVHPGEIWRLPESYKPLLWTHGHIHTSISTHDFERSRSIDSTSGSNAIVASMCYEHIYTFEMGYILQTRTLSFVGTRGDDSFSSATDRMLNLICVTSRIFDSAVESSLVWRYTSIYKMVQPTVYHVGQSIIQVSACLPSRLLFKPRGKVGIRASFVEYIVPGGLAANSSSSERRSIGVLIDSR